MENPVGNVNEIANERPKKISIGNLFFGNYSFYHFIAAEAHV